MSEAMDILECISCEQLVFPGEEVEQTKEGPVCESCSSSERTLVSLTY